MTRHSRSAPVVLSILALVAGAVGVATYSKGPPPRVSILVDVSSSNAASPCEVAPGLVKMAAEELGGGAHSVVEVSATGDWSTANEPTVVAAVEIPEPRIHGGNDRRVAAVMTRVATECAKTPTRRTSPIVLGALRAAESLRAHGCQRGSGCLLIIGSDGEETVEHRVVQNLEPPKKGQQKPSIVGLIDVPGRVIICGFSDLAQRKKREPGAPDGYWRTVTGAARQRRVWTEIFKADDVQIVPHCPRWKDERRVEVTR